MDYLGMLVATLLLLLVAAIAYRNRKRQAEILEEARLVVTFAIIDSANRFKIARETIRVVEVKRVNWPDTSLGHPEPGQFYAQVITPGFLIRLEVGGRLCECHSDYTRAVFVACKTTH